MQKTKGELSSRIIFTLSVLVVCRFGSFIPIPGIDSIALASLAQQNQGGILGMFNIEEENQMRTRLADSIRWIVCQRLLPKIGGGRIAAFEAMSTSLRVKDVILHGESEGKTFFDIIEQGKAFGMITFDSCIVDLFEKGLITEDTAIAYATNRASVNRGIDSIKNFRGEKTTNLGTLEVDKSYGKPKTEPWKK